MPDHSLSPSLFIEMVNPAWCRVYIECSFGREKRDGHLSWSSELVRKTFLTLAGFDPGKLQFSNFDQQHAALNSAREIEAGLFEADEVEQLDGQSALDYAFGWMAARDWLEGSTPVEFTDEDVPMIMDASVRYAVSSAKHHSEEFVKGFVTRSRLGVNFVA